MKAIFIEAGHGKQWPLGIKDVGAVGRFGGATYYERNIAVELARRVLVILKSKPELKDTLIQGVGVETEADIRAKMKFVNHVIQENKLPANQCLGIAIHMNAGGNATGFEAWHQIRQGNSVPLAEALARAWGTYKVTPLRPRAVNNSKNGKYGRFYIDDAICPYVIAETSFISNLSDVNAIINNYDRVAECMAHGILEYIRSLK